MEGQLTSPCHQDAKWIELSTKECSIGIRPGNTIRVVEPSLPFCAWKRQATYAISQKSSFRSEAGPGIMWVHPLRSTPQAQTPIGRVSAGGLSPTPTLRPPARLLRFASSRCGEARSCHVACGFAARVRRGSGNSLAGVEPVGAKQRTACAANRGGALGKSLRCPK